MELQFLEHNAPFEKAEVCILPVPYEGTAYFRKGAGNGPAGIMHGSLEVEYNEMELGLRTIGDGFPDGFHVMEPVEGGERKATDVCADVEKNVSRVLDAGKFPIVLGGEHSISSGAVAAVAKKYPDVSVLSIDAHADLRDEFEGNKYSHACSMRRIMEHAKRGAIVGVRSMSRECVEYLEKNPDLKWWGAEFRIADVLDALGENVYITIDLDGFDPSEVPGVGTPHPGGLSWGQGLELLREVAKKKKIVGFDVVELAPIEGQVVSEIFAAKLLYKLAGYSFFPEKLR
ncbi:MAG: agmatinase [bacterium]|nr:agmatinase [bacterium]